MRSLSPVVVGLALAVSAIFVSSAPSTAADGLDPSTLGMYVGFNRPERQDTIERELGQPVSWLITMADRGLHLLR